MLDLHYMSSQLTLEVKSNSLRKWCKVGNENFQPPCIFCVEVGYLGDEQKQPYKGQQMHRCHGNRD